MTQISTAQAPPKRKRSKAAFILAWLAFFVMIGAGIAIYFGVTGVAKAADVSTVVEGFKPERDLIASADVGFEAEFTSVELQPGEYSVVIMGAGIVYESQSDIGVLLEDDTGLTTRLEAQPVFPPNLVVRAAGGEELELRRPAFENASRAGDIESATYADLRCARPASTSSARKVRRTGFSKWASRRRETTRLPGRRRGSAIWPETAAWSLGVSVCSWSRGSCG